jgi:hypothetical protein
MHNKPFENGAKFKYSGRTVTDENYIPEGEIKSRFNSRNTCYKLVQNVLQSSLLLKTEDWNIQKTIIVSVYIWL